MTDVVPYSEYDKNEVRALLDSLPLSAEGRRVAIGMDVTFMVQVERHTRARSLITARVTGMDQEGALYFDMMTSSALEDPRHGVRSDQCWIDHTLARDEFAPRAPQMTA